MGMYLDVYELVEKSPCPIFKDADIPFEVYKCQPDRDFEAAAGRDFENEYESCSVFYCCGMSYWRPKNPDEAIAWTRKNIKEDRSKDIISVLEAMKKNEKLYFNYS